MGTVYAAYRLMDRASERWDGDAWAIEARAMLVALRYAWLEAGPKGFCGTTEQQKKIERVANGIKRLLPS